MTETLTGLGVLNRSEVLGQKPVSVEATMVQTYVIQSVYMRMQTPATVIDHGKNRRIFSSSTESFTQRIYWLPGPSSHKSISSLYSKTFMLLVPSLRSVEPRSIAGPELMNPVAETASPTKRRILPLYSSIS